jgi:hypothetical protein
MVFSPPLIGLDQVWGMLVAEVALRRIDDSDLDALFEQMRDPESVRMAAFTAADPDDRTAFDVHMAKIRTSPEVTTRAVMLDGQLVGSIASFVIEGETEVTYWIDRSFWGRALPAEHSHCSWKWLRCGRSSLASPVTMGHHSRCCGGRGSHSPPSDGSSGGPTLPKPRLLGPRYRAGLAPRRARVTEAGTGLSSISQMVTFWAATATSK